MSGSPSFPPVGLAVRAPAVRSVAGKGGAAAGGWQWHLPFVRAKRLPIFLILGDRESPAHLEASRPSRRESSQRQDRRIDDSGGSALPSAVSAITPAPAGTSVTFCPDRIIGTEPSRLERSVPVTCRRCRRRRRAHTVRRDIKPRDARPQDRSLLQTATVGRARSACPCAPLVPMSARLLGGRKGSHACVSASSGPRGPADIAITRRRGADPRCEDPRCR